MFVDLRSILERSVRGTHSMVPNISRLVFGSPTLTELAPLEYLFPLPCPDALLNASSEGRGMVGFAMVSKPTHASPEA